MGEGHEKEMSSSAEETLIVIKPDGVRRGLVGEILARFERKGFVIKRLQMQTMSKALAEEFYSVHKGKPFFAERQGQTLPAGRGLSWAHRHLVRSS